MDRRRRKRKSPLRRVKKILLMPFYVFANTLIGLKDVLDQTLLFLGITKGVRRRRNKDFERAGRESFPRVHEVDATAAAKLQKVHLERASESLNAGLRERRLLAGRGAAAKELREELETEAKSVSSGSVVGHLAKMNRKSESEAKTDDSATEEKAAPDEATEPEE